MSEGKKGFMRRALCFKFGASPAPHRIPRSVGSADAPVTGRHRYSKSGGLFVLKRPYLGRTVVSDLTQRARSAVATVVLIPVSASTHLT